MDPWIVIALYILGGLLMAGLLTAAVAKLDRQQHPLRSTARMVRGLLLPVVLIYVMLSFGLHWQRTDNGLRAVETLLWLMTIVVALSFVGNTALMRREGGAYEARYPKLLIDILRLLLVLIGGCFVISAVWDKDLGGMLTAVGVSSIVLGLALQNTLDNVMAGIAVLIERPFQIGDWITIGPVTGEVIEMNWRSVRVCTRARDLVVIPNSVIGKETLVNVTRPTRAHAERHVIGFSYDDPPNKCKRILMQVARSTRGVLVEPPLAVRTINYAAYSIEYEVRFFIDDFARQPEINDEFMTRVWYAAKRNALTIPFPIQTSYEFHQKAPAPAPRFRGVDVLQQVPVFVPLESAELEELSRDCERYAFGKGERIVHQGDPGDAMYIVLEGNAVVSIKTDSDAEREVARLSRGEFFGEMALLTGEPRTASVTAIDDLSVLVIHKDSLRAMLARRPGLALAMAETVEARRLGLRAVQDLLAAAPDKKAAVQRSAGELVQRIRRFFGL